MTSLRLALSNLLHERGRTIISVVGAAFAVVLVFMQLGFLGSVENTATLLYGKMRFDLLITSTEYIDLSRPGLVNRTRLAQAESAAGVKEVLPVSLGTGTWRNPTDDPQRGRKLWQLSMVGIDPGTLDRVFLPPTEGGIFRDDAEQREAGVRLAQIDSVLLDRKSKPYFGKPTEMPPGTETELNGRRVQLAGYFQAGTGFSYSGLLLTNEETFAKYTGRPTKAVNFGLVTLKPGEDANVVAKQLRDVLPADVQVFTRSEMEAGERSYWVNKTAVGKFFYFGVLLAITVGAIFIYQMMVADIKKHMPEYATLKAMGYRFGFLFRVVVNQALFLAFGGYAIGLVVALGLYELTKLAAGIPIGMTWGRVGLVFVLTVGMCVASALLAVRKVRTADPAELF
jgi:putative ABC transport system permease protein